MIFIVRLDKYLENKKGNFKYLTKVCVAENFL